MFSLKIGKIVAFEGFTKFNVAYKTIVIDDHQKVHVRDFNGSVQVYDLSLLDMKREFDALKSVQSDALITEESITMPPLQRKLIWETGEIFNNKQDQGYEVVTLMRQGNYNC